MGSGVRFEELLREYLSERLHPHIVGLWSKYPKLFENPFVIREMKKRYPSTRLTDEEYNKMWTDEICKTDYFLSKVCYDAKFDGATIAIPLPRNTK